LRNSSSLSGIVKLLPQDMHNSNQFFLHSGWTPADQTGYLRRGQAGGKTKRQKLLLWA
jgi:hypothetical protein